MIAGYQSRPIAGYDPDGLRVGGFRMDWRSRLGPKLVAAQEAVSHVGSGATVGVSPFTTTPLTLCEELASRARAGSVSDVRSEEHTLNSSHQRIPYAVF